MIIYTGKVFDVKRGRDQIIVVTRHGDIVEHHRFDGQTEASTFIEAHTYADWATVDLIAEHARLSKLKAWRPVNDIERELRNRQPVELSQDAYYYGTAADMRTNR